MLTKQQAQNSQGDNTNKKHTSSPLTDLLPQMGSFWYGKAQERQTDTEIACLNVVNEDVMTAIQ